VNYYQAQELAKDGKPSGIWHYTCQNDRRIWPVGYCADGCAGHATAEEAQEHYRQWQLDTAKYDGRIAHQQQRCQVCDAWTQGYASIEPGMTHMFILCDEHRNRDELAKLVESPGWMTSSW
jgi:hypothetical protein